MQRLDVGFRGFSRRRSIKFPKEVDDERVIDRHINYSRDCVVNTRQLLGKLRSGQNEGNVKRKRQAKAVKLPRKLYTRIA